MNFVATLTTDTRTISNPTWAEVEHAISALDARTETLVMLAPPPPKGAPVGECHMAVGGGADDRFIVYITEDNLKFWNLVDPETQADHRNVGVLIGGQVGEYRESQFVSRALALRAARDYVTDGVRAIALTWIEG